MFCPLHRLPALYGTDLDHCATCERLGIRAITCELDKIDRTRDTMETQGHELDHFHSHAVLVFKLRKDSILEGSDA